MARTRARFGIIAALATALTLVASGQQPAQLKVGLDGTDAAVWLPLGAANFRAERGEIVATVQPGGGWLVANRGYQDVAVKFSFRCTGKCQAGILLGMQDAGDRVDGLFVSLTDNDLTTYEMPLDARGQELERRKLAPAAGMGAGAGAGGGRQGGVPPTAPVGHPLSVPPPPPPPPPHPPT